MKVQVESIMFKISKMMIMKDEKGKEANLMKYLLFIRLLINFIYAEIAILHTQKVKLLKSYPPQKERKKERRWCSEFKW